MIKRAAHIQKIKEGYGDKFSGKRRLSMAEKKEIERLWDKPTLSLLAKLGAIIIHAQEFIEPGGHELDRYEIEIISRDADVQAWLKEGVEMGLLPRKRSLRESKG